MNAEMGNIKNILHCLGVEHPMAARRGKMAFKNK